MIVNTAFLEKIIFFKIYLPISKPGIATVFFVEYVAKWNSIMLPATLITDQNKYTLPLMLKAMIMQDDSTSGAALAPDNAVMAAIVISTIPLLLIYIFAQRFLLAGMSLGATKAAPSKLMLSYYSFVAPRLIPAKRKR